MVSGWQDGLGLMVAEAHIGVFGVIGIGGIIAFVIGAVMMFPSAAPGYKLSPVVIAGTVIVTAGLFLLVLSMLLRSRKRLVVTGKEALLGAENKPVAWWGEDGRVRIRGEIWRARAVKPLQPGTRVKVIDRDGLVLIVEST
jgi:membrane-bound serine protease (ClpP class)